MAIIFDFWERIRITKKPKRYSDQEIIFQLEIVQLNKKQSLLDKDEQTTVLRSDRPR